MTPGKLFVFEGADASGKSSLAALFLDWLRAMGVDAELMSFPGKVPGTIGELVYRIHHNSESVGVNGLTATSLQTLHIAAHIDAIETRIIPSLQAGKAVVLDRYWWSTRIYGLASGVPRGILDKLIEAEFLAWGDYIPTALFCISRSNPLRNEPLQKWEEWKRAYEAMFQRESGRHPMFLIPNEKGIDDCLSEVIRCCPTFA